MSFAERGCAALLIHGHHRMSKDGMDEGRLTSIEIPNDEDFGQRVPHTGRGAFVWLINNRLFGLATNVTEEEV